MHSFTVFTATYNRSHTLHRVFDSLCKQTCKDFEWIIIDDGSVDNTKEVVDNFKRKAEFPIQYFYQKNKHKFYSLLFAIRNSNGYLFLPCDSDDEFEENTLEFFYSKFSKFESLLKSQLVGINCHCKNQFGDLIGNLYPEDPIITDHLEIIFKYGIKGEKWGCLKTEVLRQYVFEDNFFSNGYIPEGILWTRIANDGYKIVCFNDILRTYYVNEANSSIMSSAFQDIKKNIFGIVESNLLTSNLAIKYIRNSPFLYFKHLILYFAYAWTHTKSLTYTYSRLNCLPRILSFLILPIIFLYKLKIQRYFE